LPERWRAERDAIADGLAAASAANGCRIVGGDTTRGRDLAIAITVLGSAEHPLRRAGANPDDVLYVTGRLGGPAAAVRAWERGGVPDEWERQRFARPSARIREARWLARHGATAAIDISDGLSGDLTHLAAASAVRIVVDVDRLPRRGAAEPDEGAAAMAAFASGEEYELAVAAPAGLDVARFEQEFGVPLTAVGHVERGASVEARLHGARVALPAGYDHFSA
jgi:thiamine-monophosphate kinase